MSENNRKIIIVGGGLVGSLCACFLGQKGYNVTVYEQRNDIRIVKFLSGKSINLSLSNRGRLALRMIHLEEEVLKNATPMKGRMVHDQKGNTKEYIYDKLANQCIYSVNRNYLNKMLVKATETYPNIKWRFNHKVVQVRLSDGTISVQSTESNEVLTDSADLIIGADGAFSTIRRTLQSSPRFQFSQTYIAHGYIELSIRSERAKELFSDYLHIWPRGEFMMIALPNQDHSWTVTLFMSFDRFKTLTNSDQINSFFQATFPDAFVLLDDVVDTVQRSDPNPLISIKCDPYHFISEERARFLLIGDAAHAMVPFYGQGMNAGFEDCWLLDQILDQYQDLDQALMGFSKRRVQDGHAICDLAMYNYVEMRDLVLRRSFSFRKRFDDTLFGLCPTYWQPLYNSVTFSNWSYRTCMEHRKWQNLMLQRISFVIGLGIVTLSALWLVVLM